MPFPEDARFHEDMHTWLRYSAAGAEVVHTPVTPSRYWIVAAGRGSSSRERAGGIEAFNRPGADVISGGPREAIERGTRRGVVSHSSGHGFSAAFASTTRYDLTASQPLSPGRQGSVLLLELRVHGVGERFNRWGR